MGGHGNRVNTPADGWSVIIHLNKGPAGISGCGTILFSFIFTRGQVSCQGKYFFLFSFVFNLNFLHRHLFQENYTCRQAVFSQGIWHSQADHFGLD